MTPTQTPTKAPSQAFLRQRRFLVLLPVLVLPFLTFLLWSIGLIGTDAAQAQKTKQSAGLNMNLPDARLKENKTWDKLSFYEQADKDSAKYKEQLRNDPYYNVRSLDSSKSASTSLYGNSKLDYDPSPNSINNYKDPNEEKVNRKLAQLNEVLSKSAAGQQGLTDSEPSAKRIAASANSGDIDRLENMLQSINQKGDSADPEMQGIHSVMENILDIQHPERVQEKLKQQSLAHRSQVYPVVLSKQDNISLLQNTKKADYDTVQRHGDSTVLVALARHNRFYTFGENAVSEQAEREVERAIEAVVHETQTLVSGSTVKLRLLSDVYIGGVLVPKDNFVFGVAALNGERLTINIHAVRYANTLLPVALSVYDMDAMEGIHVPGAISRDVAKQSSDQALQGVGLTTLDPSLGAQAASAGIEAAKTLIGKKVKLIRVVVKAGYRVLLKDTNRQIQ